MLVTITLSNGSTVEAVQSPREWRELVAAISAQYHQAVTVRTPERAEWVISNRAILAAARHADAAQETDPTGPRSHPTLTAAG